MSVGGALSPLPKLNLESNGTSFLAFSDGVFWNKVICNLPKNVTVQTPICECKMIIDYFFVPFKKLFI